MVQEESPREPRAKQSLLGRSPAWLISIVLHAVIVLAATAFYIERYVLEDDSVYLTEIRHADQPKVAELEKPPEKPKEPPKEDPADNEAESQSLPPGEADPDPSAGNADSSNAADLASQDGSGGRPNVYDAIGVGEGGGTRSGRRSGPAQPAKKAARGTGDKSVRAALRWLARHQSGDGSWSVTQFSKSCGQHGYKDTCASSEPDGNEQFDVGVTGLALLAFLGAGYSPSNREPVYAQAAESHELSELLGEARKLTYGDIVKRACKHLIASQAPNGRLGPEVDRYIYNHLIGTLALCEAYGMTGIWLLRTPAERAIQFIIDSKSPGGGWRYSFQSQETDSSVTGWAVMTLKSAETARLSFDRSVFDDVRRWFDQATVTASIPAKSLGDSSWDERKKLTLTGYLNPKDAGNLVSVSGLNERYYYTPALTAVMVMSTVMMDKKATQKAERAVDTLMTFLPAQWSPQDKATWKKADFYYWYYASYALFQLTSNDDPRWKRWNDALKSALIETQNLKDAAGQCVEGSWEPVDRWSCEGGRVYTTAIGALTLEVYYRYPKVLALDKKETFIKLNDD